MKKFIHQQRQFIGNTPVDQNRYEDFRLCIFRCGPLIDLCRGPHIRHTGKVKAFAVTKVKKNHF